MSETSKITTDQVLIALRNLTGARVGCGGSRYDVCICPVCEKRKAEELDADLGFSALYEALERLRAEVRDLNIRTTEDDQSLADFGMACDAADAALAKARGESK